MSPEPQLEFFQTLEALAWPPLEGIAHAGAVAADELRWGNSVLRIWYVLHRSARRYRLSLRAGGEARCTLPSRGSLSEARRFVTKVRPWLIHQYERRQACPIPSKHWVEGTPVWFRGVPFPLQIESLGGEARRRIQIGEHVLKLTPLPNSIANLESGIHDFRPAVEAALRRLAEPELRARVHSLATEAGIEVVRISIRNQRTRWGSCSRRGVISLNWRLVQTPNFVRDYIILHELAHRRHLNHSEQFWAEVARLCPEWEAAEAWIKRFGRELR